MPIRRINHTGRKRIKQSDAQFTVYDNGNGSAKFDVDLDLSNYDLPGEANVVVEAYRQTSWMRFPAGNVESISIPTNRDLIDFDTSEGILFRVKVTTTSNPEGLLIAEADQIRPRHPDNDKDDRTPLISVKPDDNLGYQIWKLDFRDRPIILINSGLDIYYRDLVRDPAFVSLVLPSALHQVLTWILIVENHFETDDDSDWKCLWLQFALQLPGVSELPDPDEGDSLILEDWIGNVVASFCRNSGIKGFYTKYWEEVRS